MSDFQSAADPLQLTMPVLTDPGTMQQAVAGIYRGKISLSWSNVEPILVLANSIGVTQLVHKVDSSQSNHQLSHRLTQLACLCSSNAWRQHAKTSSDAKCVNCLNAPEQSGQL